MSKQNTFVHIFFSVMLQSKIEKKEEEVMNVEESVNDVMRTRILFTSRTRVRGAVVLVISLTA